MSAVTQTETTFHRGDVVRYDARANGEQVGRIIRVELIKTSKGAQRFYLIEGERTMTPHADVIEVAA